MGEKRLSEFLKENGAYESFIENCVKYFLENTKSYKDFTLNNREIKINVIFLWEYVEEGYDYWQNLNEHKPKNLIYDINETIFKKVNEKLKGGSQLESKPKTLSEYLKENNAYESFVEICVENFLKDLVWYKASKLKNENVSFGDIFIWEESNEIGSKYWYELFMNRPYNIIYDMNEIIFAEVDKRI